MPNENIHFVPVILVNADEKAWTPTTTIVLATIQAAMHCHSVHYVCGAFSLHARNVGFSNTILSARTPHTQPAAFISHTQPLALGTRAHTDRRQPLYVTAHVPLLTARTTFVCWETVFVVLAAHEIQLQSERITEQCYFLWVQCTNIENISMKLSSFVACFHIRQTSATLLKFLNFSERRQAISFALWANKIQFNFYRKSK